MMQRSILLTTTTTTEEKAEEEGEQAPPEPDSPTTRFPHFEKAAAPRRPHPSPSHRLQISPRLRWTRHWKRSGVHDHAHQDLFSSNDWQNACPVMSGMIWVLLIMQLAAHGTQAEETMQFVSHHDHAEVSDSQLIVPELNTAEKPKEHLVSCEIKPLSVDDNNDNTDANEETHLVIQDAPQCRICLDNEGDDLIAPCRCKGTQKYVHRSCLDNWRSTKEGFAFSHCTECRAAFILRANVPPDRWWLRLKFQLLVVRDHTLIFFIVQLVVAFLGMVVYRFYGDELREMFGYEEHPYAFYALGILAIILVGLLYGFFIAIICGQRITERHYHVLAKQELTKEYVVEDLEGAGQVPDLDPSHVTELKILGLY